MLRPPPCVQTCSVCRRVWRGEGVQTGLRGDAAAGTPGPVDVWRWDTLCGYTKSWPTPRSLWSACTCMESSRFLVRSSCSSVVKSWIVCSFRRRCFRTASILLVTN